MEQPDHGLCFFFHARFELVHQYKRVVTKTLLRGRRFGQVQTGLQLRRGDVAVGVRVEEAYEVRDVLARERYFPFEVLGRRVGDAEGVI